MKASKLEILEKISKEVENFRAVYEYGPKLHGNRDGFVGCSDILEMLTDNPALAEVAQNIAKLEQELKQEMEK